MPGCWIEGHREAVIISLIFWPWLSPTWVITDVRDYPAPTTRKPDAVTEA